MAQIRILDDSTINQIAAGEVVERPVSVVKELVENACDAGAENISVEIKDGGISLIRVTDNGFGITKDNIKTAFLRHATSKINCIEDLMSIRSLGFRGEALSSIASVAQVELLTKCKGELLGYRYCIEGGREMSLDEAGIPEGTTMLVRNLFYNTPARRKFLKSPTTEGNLIADLMERLVLSHPEIGFKFIMNGKEKIVSSGNGDIKENIYQLYGRDMANSCIGVEAENECFSMKGYIGKPENSRGNRNYELFFVNNRLIKSNILSKAVEEAYKSFLMLHKFPFAVLYFDIPSKDIDVNVHPAKTEIKFLNEEYIYDAIVKCISEALSNKEMIPKVKSDAIHLSAPAVREAEVKTSEVKTPEVKTPEVNTPEVKAPEVKTLEVNTPEVKASEVKTLEVKTPEVKAPEVKVTEIKAPEAKDVETESIDDRIFETKISGTKVSENSEIQVEAAGSIKEDKIIDHANAPEPFEKEKINRFKEAQSRLIKEELTDIKQENLFTDNFLSDEALKKHKIVGQLFNTYWIVEMYNNMYIIDQHAAHEKVLYERFKKRIDGDAVYSQALSPAVVVTLSTSEASVYERYKDNFKELGFCIEAFGGNDYCISEVPVDLFGLSEEDYFLSIIDDLMEYNRVSDPKAVNDRIASMACKAAIKGNMSISVLEAKALIDELLKLDNPYNCPHGRPTIISYSKSELEKLFKRIV